MFGIETLLEVKSLAEHDIKFQALLNDTTSLQGLVLILSNKNISLVSLAVQIFRIISLRPGATNVLRSLIGLPEQLRDLTIRHKGINSIESRTISEVAHNLLKILEINQSSEGTRNQNENTCINEKSDSRLRPKSVLLQLYGLENENDVQDVSAKLLKVKGVVSITFQLHKHRVLVCTIPTLNSETLVQAINQIDSNVKTKRPTQYNVTAQIVRRKQRVNSLYRKNSCSNPKTKPSHKSTNYPQYLDENADLFEVDESKAAPKLRQTNPIDEKNHDKGPIGWLTDLLDRSLFW